MSIAVRRVRNTSFSAAVSVTFTHAIAGTSGAWFMASATNDDTGSVSGRVTKNGQGVFAAHVVAFDRVMQEAVVVLEIAIRAELGEQLGAAVVVAGHEIDRHGERLEDVAQHPVFLGEPAVSEVAAGDHQVGLARQAFERGHRRFEHGVGIDPAVGDLAARPDMHVGDLGDHHGVVLPHGNFSDVCST